MNVLNLNINLSRCLIGILGVVVAICLITQKTSFFTEEKSPPSRLSAPKAYMKHVFISRFTTTGQLKETLQATHWFYEPTNATSTLQEPHLTLYKSANMYWTMQAKHATAHHQTLASAITQLQLNDTVILKRHNHVKPNPLTITTNALTYYPACHHAITDEPVHE